MIVATKKADWKWLLGKSAYDPWGNAYTKCRGELGSFM